MRDYSIFDFDLLNINVTRHSLLIYGANRRLFVIAHATSLPDTDIKQRNYMSCKSCTYQAYMIVV